MWNGEIKMTIEKELKKLCKENGDVELTGVNLAAKYATVRLPYETAEVTIDLEGDSEEEIMESFKENVNYRLDRMIDHLNDCKF